MQQAYQMHLQLTESMQRALSTGMLAIDNKRRSLYDIKEYGNDEKHGAKP